MNQWKRYGPFGSGGHDVGNFAISMYLELQQPKQADRYVSGPEWDKSDVIAFEDFGQIVTGIRFIEPEPGLDGAEIGDLHRDFHHLLAATPFSEGERRWIYETPNQRRGQGLEELVGKATEIMEAGVYGTVSGRDLARRWWAWRRESQEFAGQNSLGEARGSLGNIALKLVNEPNWPVPHRRLRRQLRDSPASRSFTPPGRNTRMD